jgi:hypothetical protein
MTKLTFCCLSVRFFFTKSTSMSHDFFASTRNSLFTVLNVLKIIARCYQAVCLSAREHHPVASFKVQQTEASALEEFADIAPGAQIEWRLSSQVHKMFVPPLVDALVCRHSDEHDLIDLNGRENCHPKQMKPNIEKHPADPRRTAIENQDRIPDSVAEREITSVFVKRDASVKQQDHRGENEEKKQHECLMITNANVVVDPRTVMIEFL